MKKTVILACFLVLTWSAAANCLELPGLDRADAIVEGTIFRDKSGGNEYLKATLHLEKKWLSDRLELVASPRFSIGRDGDPTAELSNWGQDYWKVSYLTAEKLYFSFRFTENLQIGAGLNVFETGVVDEITPMDQGSYYDQLDLLNPEKMGRWAVWLGIKPVKKLEILYALGPPSYGKSPVAPENSWAPPVSDELGARQVHGDMYPNQLISAKLRISDILALTAWLMHGFSAFYNYTLDEGYVEPDFHKIDYASMAFEAAAGGWSCKAGVYVIERDEWLDDAVGFESELAFPTVRIPPLPGDFKFKLGAIAEKVFDSGVEYQLDTSRLYSDSLFGKIAWQRGEWFGEASSYVKTGNDYLANCEFGRRFHWPPGTASLSVGLDLMDDFLAPFKDNNRGYVKLKLEF